MQLLEDGPDFFVEQKPTRSHPSRRLAATCHIMSIDWEDWERTGETGSACSFSRLASRMNAFSKPLAINTRQTGRVSTWHVNK